VLELSPDLDPEEVAEIFIRINSKGKDLNQSDFILTLMSVYWPEGRKQLEQFHLQAHNPPTDNKPSSFNILNIVPYPEQLIRTIVAYSFNRGSLKYAYLILKGRDFENRQTSLELREKNFTIFKKGQEKVLHLTNWHNFIKILYGAGFIKQWLISSKLTFFITYAVYLKLLDEDLPHKEVESLVRKWFVFSILTQRYASSPEFTIEDDFYKMREEGVASFINSNISTYLTNDFWNFVLPQRLESSSTRNFGFLVYLASLVHQDANVLFSDVKLRDYIAPAFKSPKKAIDLHHIYPKAYLKKHFNLTIRQYNQIANLIHLEYQDNIKIGDRPPKDYWPKFTSHLSKTELHKLYDTYALPPAFPDLDYFTFLSQRRVLMAKKIQQFFNNL